MLFRHAGTEEGRWPCPGRRDRVARVFPGERFVRAAVPTMEFPSLWACSQECVTAGFLCRRAAESKEGGVSEHTSQLSGEKYR